MRSKPYSEIGLKRMACSACNKAKASEQWSLRPCVIGKHVWFAICLDCDLELNAKLLEFFNHPEAEQLMIDYRKRKTNATDD